MSIKFILKNNKLTIRSIWKKEKTKKRSEIIAETKQALPPQRCNLSVDVSRLKGGLNFRISVGAIISR